MATLTNTKIKDTYDGLLKTTDNEALDVSGVTLIEDGLGNASALSVGRSGNGVTITGSLNATLATAAQPNITSVGTLSSLSVSGNLAVDTNTLYVDAANNLVGIGISSGLTYPLTIQGATGVNNSYVHFVNATTGTAFSDGTQIGVPDGQSYFLINQREASDIRINTGGSEAMRIDSSGNVGINCSPATKLEILGDSGYSNTDIAGGKAAQGLHINANSGGVGGYGGAISLGTGGAGSSAIVAVSGAGSDLDVNGIAFFTHGSSGGSNPNAEAMRIDSSGNVGIGSSDPKERFEVLGRNGNIRIYGRSGIADNQITSNVYWNGSSWSRDNTSYGSSAIGLNDGGTLNFYTTSATSGFPDERMRIDSSGSIHIGRQGGSLSTAGYSFVKSGNTAYAEFVHSNTGDGSANLYLSRANNGTAILFYRGDLSSTVGSISVTTTATAYNTSSDYRLKENVVEMTGALDRVDALKPSRFNFIADPEKTVDGFLAHEVAEVVPEAISGEKDAVDEEGNPIYQGIDQSKIVPLLVGAIKELRAEIELLKSQLNA